MSRDLAQELSGAIFRSAIRRAAAGEANVELNFGFAKINLRKGSVSVRFEPSFVADVQEHENQSLVWTEMLSCVSRRFCSCVLLFISLFCVFCVYFV